MSLTYLRNATPHDLSAISQIINDAKTYLFNARIDQWQDAYPNRQQLEADILHQQSYVLIVQKQIAATAVLMSQPEANYQHIQGAWQSSQPYITIHRVAVSQQFSGQHLSRILFSNLISIAYQGDWRNFRIDTHPDNYRMQHLITQNGFQYRGIIHLNDAAKSQRWAYELNL
ncbi:GNAT family N-acetyltransferase [Bombilactobacillus bombi]|uniref:GNAT family N-acetyltransferase n=1 Tax=Bombilactobacillus bombi TaxID=1303590 RepID=UPI0015E5B68E|nr:GNAT family N-acetyltransferase [Bombilactobacillus bombi]MBA1434129.1 GNAT family N-acetyltransferase [Bombilactobacillus bombi]